jgi:hypothetical protein
MKLIEQRDRGMRPRSESSGQPWPLVDARLAHVI